MLRGGFLAEYGRIKSLIAAITATFFAVFFLSSGCSSISSSFTSDKTNKEINEDNSISPNIKMILIGSIFIFLAIIIPISSWLVFYFTKESKTFAQITAIGDIIS